MDKDQVVAPGERLATEEEFNAGQNAYVENGVIYSAVFGTVSKQDGLINVISGTGREVKLMDKGMIVLGKVTDDMKSVIFVKLDPIMVGKKAFLALKDGKIIPEKPRPGSGRPMGRMGSDNKFHDHSREKLCGVGDTILARILFNDKDSYALGVREPELGVVYARCNVCGEEMDFNKDMRVLVCNQCGSTDRRKVSLFYGSPEKIKAIFN